MCNAVKLFHIHFSNYYKYYKYKYILCTIYFNNTCQLLTFVSGLNVRSLYFYKTAEEEKVGES